MKTMYDVIVVGAGPAGSVAARKAAEAGLDVLLIEKRQEIGAPVRCAEAVGGIGTQDYIAQDERWIDAHISSYAIYNTEGDAVTVPPTEHTWIVNRKVFDFELAHLAANAGAHVLTSTAAVGLLKNGVVEGVTVRRFGKNTDVRARLVIAADGTESQVARWAGLKTVPPMGDFYSGAQYLLGNIGGKFKPDVAEYHVGQSIAPAGYVWVFPKGNDSANVGLVIGADHADKVSARELLDRFCAAHFPDASVLSVVVGGIPATGAIKQMVTDGLMVVGDAAHQADPLTAGGINLGMIGADLAMQVGVAALRDNDLSTDRLREYERKWSERFSKMHTALYQIRKIITRMDESMFNALVKTASTLPLADMSTGEALIAILKAHPKLLFEARTLITTGLILK